MKYYPSYWQSLGLLLLLLLFTLVSVLIVMPFFSYRSNVGLTLIYTLSIVFTILAGLWIRKDFRFKWNGIYPMIVLLSTIIFLGSHIFLDPLTSLFPVPEILKKTLLDTLEFPVASFVTMVIAAPLLEELLFRGVMLDGLLRNYSPGRAIFFNAFLFGLIHGNFAQGLGAMIGGLVIGWVYWKTQSIIPCIIIHFLNNLVAYVSIINTPREDLFNDLSREFDNPFYYWILVATCGMVMSFSLWVLYNKCLKNISPKEKNTEIESVSLMQEKE
ncbi:MAG: type II CAAX prenyl endopeptidase Rce1 family protein [Flammeovirgaceae bacterium]